MYLDKTQYETSLDLGLYIEGLLTTDEIEVEIKSETKTEIETKLETVLLNDLVYPDFEENVPVLEQKVAEQSDVPLWGAKPFECLLIKSAGMNLMVPAMSVSYIEQINKKIIRLPLDVEAFRGVVTLRERSVAVIDLFTLISESGSSVKKSLAQVSENHVEHVIVMDNGNFALACDDIGKMVTLETENVRWNKASFNNPMFAGIVPEYLCPIINIDNVQQQIAAMPFVQSLNKNY
jgi:purine-binding chemotaxis protein CheW